MYPIPSNPWETWGKGGWVGEWEGRMRVLAQQLMWRKHGCQVTTENQGSKEAFGRQL